MRGMIAQKLLFIFCKENVKVYQRKICLWAGNWDMGYCWCGAGVYRWYVEF